MSIVEVPVASLSEVDDWIKENAGLSCQISFELYEHLLKMLPTYKRFGEKLEFLGRFVKDGRSFTCPLEHRHRIFTANWPFAHRWHVARAEQVPSARLILGRRCLPYMSLGV